MYPILFEIPGLGLPLHSFGLMLAIAFLVGMWRLGRYARPIGIDPQKVSDLSVWIVFAAIIGCRVLYFVVHPDELVRDGFFSTILAFFEVWRGGMVFYGGFILATLVGIWKCRQYGFPLVPFADITFVSVFLGMFIGRWGCLLVGDDYGDPVDPSFIFALKVPNPLPEHSLFPRPPADGDLYLHPTQLYMSACGLFLFIVGHFILKRQRAWGVTTCWLLVLYSIIRSTIEFARGDDHARGWFIHEVMSTSQAISIPIFLLGVWGLWKLRKRRGDVPVYPALVAANK